MSGLRGHEGIAPYDISALLQLFSQINLLFRPAFFLKSMLQKQRYGRVVDGNIVIQNRNAVLFRRTAQQVQRLSAEALSSVFGIDDNVRTENIFIGVITVRNFADKVPRFIFQIPVVPLTFRISDPAVIPARPPFLRERNCSASGMVTL